MKKIIINITQQSLRLTEAGHELMNVPCSSGSAGIGTEEGSGCTPLGLFSIASKHGENANSATIFRGRIPVGTWSSNTQVEDAILARILTLHGEEEHNANTRARYIYIHGTNDSAKLGTPASYGCIRLAPADMIALYNLTPLGTSVLIEA